MIPKLFGIYNLLEISFNHKKVQLYINFTNKYLTNNI